MKKYALLVLVSILSMQLAFGYTSLTVNGTSYPFPENSDLDWGDSVSNWATAVTSTLFPQNGGTFTLGGDVDFGATYGLKAPYFRDRSSSAATIGLLRLSNTASIAWRNSTNNANLGLLPYDNNTLQFAGVKIPTISSTDELTNKTMSGASNTFTNINAATVDSGSIVDDSVNATAAIAYSKLNLSSSIKDADVSTSAAIVYSKLSLASSIVDGDISTSAAISYSKLNLASSILDSDVATSSDIYDAGTKKHTQNSDTGTSATSWIINSGATQLTIAGDTTVSYTINAAKLATWDAAGAATAQDVATSTTAFDGMLSTANVNVQSALDTIDEAYKNFVTTKKSGVARISHGSYKCVSDSCTIVAAGSGDWSVAYTGGGSEVSTVTFSPAFPSVTAYDCTCSAKDLTQAVCVGTSGDSAWTSSTISLSARHTNDTMYGNDDVTVGFQCIGDNN